MLTAAAGLTPQQAAAQPDECDPLEDRGPLEVTPAAGASGVPLDHPLRILFTPGYFSLSSAPPPDEAFEVRGPDDQRVPGEVQLVADDVLFFVPSSGWQPSTEYTGTAFGESSRAFDFSFRTGTTTDTQPPTVSPLSYSASTPIPPSCELPDGGYRVDLELSASLDDGAAGSIEYHLYLARAEGLESPVQLTRLRNFASVADARVPISFLLEERFAASPICVQLMAVDGIGNVASSSPFCFDPVEGALFAGLCAASPPAHRRSGWPHGRAGAVAVMLLGLLRTRRRRSPPPKPL